MTEGPLTAVPDDELQSHLDSGENYTEIGERYGVTKQAVGEQVEQRGLEIPEDSDLYHIPTNDLLTLCAERPISPDALNALSVRLVSEDGSLGDGRRALADRIDYSIHTVNAWGWPKNEKECDGKAADKVERVAREVCG